MTFATHLERQFIQRLRGAGWVKASALPPSPRLVQTLLQKGWIETTKSGPTEVVLRCCKMHIEIRSHALPA